MAYVSAQYQPPTSLDIPGAPRQVQAIDTEGTVWALREDSQQREWQRYLENGGTIDPAPSVPLNTRILSAPDTLFGGPTVAQTLGESG